MVLLMAINKTLIVSEIFLLKAAWEIFSVNTSNRARLSHLINNSVHIYLKERKVKLKKKSSSIDIVLCLYGILCVKCPLMTVKVINLFSQWSWKLSVHWVFIQILLIQ